MLISFNENQALKVFRILDECYRGGRGIFKGAVLPQDRWPSPLNAVEHANWLFVIAHFMRGGAINDDQFKWFYKLFEAYPQIFNPSEVAKNWPPKKIEAALRKMAPEINGQTAKNAGTLSYKLQEHLINWHLNLNILHDCWQDNILNVFLNANDFEQIFRRADYRRSAAGFTGMRRKIFSLLTIWFQERNLIPFFPAPIPVDFHALRIMLATEIIIIGDIEPIKINYRYPSLAGKKGLRVTEELVDSIAVWSQKFLAKIGLSHLIINPAAWILSRELCPLSFQCQSRKKATEYADPEKLETGHLLWPKGYNDPCLLCPLEKFCVNAIPSAPYYRWGLLVLFKRVKYLGKKSCSLVLPGMDEEMFIRGAKGRRK